MSLFVEHGVQAPRSVVWKGWHIDGEFERKFLLKNVGAQIVRLKYRVPPSQRFHLPFPELIELAPGTSVPIQISFKPVESVNVNDDLTFILYDRSGQATNKRFSVKLQAQLPVLSMKSQSEPVEFGIRPILEVSERKLTLQNDGDIPAQFNWKLPSDASLFASEIIPSNGRIEPGQSVECLLHLLPHACGVISADLVCSYWVASTQPLSRKSLFEEKSAYDQVFGSLEGDDDELALPPPPSSIESDDAMTKSLILPIRCTAELPQLYWCDAVTPPTSQQQQSFEQLPPLLNAVGIGCQSLDLDQDPDETRVSTSRSVVSRMSSASSINSGFSSPRSPRWRRPAQAAPPVFVGQSITRQVRLFNNVSFFFSIDLFVSLSSTHTHSVQHRHHVFADRAFHL